MQSSLKYILAIASTIALSQSQAEMVQSSFTNDNDNSRLAARVLNKDAQGFNSHFSNLNSLSITERSGDKIRRETIAAKIEIPEEEPSVIEKLILLHQIQSVSLVKRVWRLGMVVSSTVVKQQAVKHSI